MAQLYGRDEVRRQRQRLESVFRLIDGQNLDAELEAHYARYLAIRLSGFAEQSLKDLASAYARSHASSEVHGFVEKRLSRIWGINQEKLKETLDGFNVDWYKTLSQEYPEEISALHSVGKLRDNVAHGGDSGIGLVQVGSYKTQIFLLVNQLEKLLDPPVER